MRLCGGANLFVCLLLIVSRGHGDEDDDGDDDDVTQVHRLSHRSHRQQQQQQPSTSDSTSTIGRQQWINRERKRQIRLFNIQRLIMERVGFETAPNMSVHQLSDERLHRHTAASAAAATAVDTAHLPANYLAHRIITLLPTCHTSEIRQSTRNNDSNDGLVRFTIEFNLGTIQRRSNVQTNLVTATLNLRKKLRRTDNVSRRRWRRPRPTGSRDQLASDGDSAAVADGGRGRRSSSSYQRRRRPSAFTRSRALRVTVSPTTNPETQNVRLVRASHVGWVSVDVNRSVSDWLQSLHEDSSPQISLSVVVSDARSRTPINPFNVFQSPNCSETHQSHRGDEVNGEPYLQLVTVDVPRSTPYTTHAT